MELTVAAAQLVLTLAVLIIMREYALHAQRTAAAAADRVELKVIMFGAGLTVLGLGSRKQTEVTADVDL